MPTAVLIDSNVLLDISTEDPEWFEWSAKELEKIADEAPLVINPLIYAEVSMSYRRVEDLDVALPFGLFRREPLPYEAGFLAGRAFLKYKKRGGARRSPLPDFYIGAHAAISGLRLLTRDAKRYRTYFPTVDLISPK